MVFWYVGVSLAFVWNVFRSPALDYRLVMLGSVLPLIEVVFGGPRLLHTLLASVALLGVVMLATRGRRLLRRRLISLPIGLMTGLVLDGAWASKAVFWWPAFGTAFPGGGLPELQPRPRADRRARADRSRRPRLVLDGLRLVRRGQPEVVPAHGAPEPGAAAVRRPCR